MNTNTKRLATYTRCAPEETQQARGELIAKANQLPATDSQDMLHYGDALAGARGFNRMMGDVRGGRIGTLFVRKLSDLGSNIDTLLTTLAEILKARVAIVVTYDGVTTESHGALQTIRALLTARAFYTAKHRRDGLARAREQGAQIGRPAGATLADVQEDVKRLMNGRARRFPNEPSKHFPSVRELHRECGVSVGTAARLLKEFRAQPPELELDTAYRPPPGTHGNCHDCSAPFMDLSARFAWRIGGELKDLCCTCHDTRGGSKAAEYRGRSLP